MHSKNLRAYLDSAAGIAGLLPHAERLIELRRVYSELVPQQLSRSSSIVNYKGQKVVIFAENNAIAAKLRLLTPRLVNDFCRSGQEVTGIRIEVQPRQDAAQVPRTEHAELGFAGARSLEALASRLPDSPLKQSVMRIAAHAEQTPEPPCTRPDDQNEEQARKAE